MPDTLTITDNRTAKAYDLPIQADTIRSADLAKIKAGEDPVGLGTTTRRSSTRRPVAARSPTSTATRASCAIAAIRSSSWPSRARSWKSPGCSSRASSRPTTSSTASRGAIHDNRVPPARIERIFDGLAEDPHPMGALIAAFGALGTFYPEAHNVGSAEVRRRQIHRIVAQAPALAAYAARRRRGEIGRAAGRGPELRRQLSLHAQGDAGHALHAASGAGTGARHPVRAARRSRAELLHLRDAERRQLDWPIPTRRSPRRRRRSTVRCTAAPTKPCSGCSTPSARSTRCPRSSRR